MFLDILQDRNKEMFLEACVSAGGPGRGLTDRGRKAILAYCRELEVAGHIPESGCSLTRITAKLAGQADEPERRAIALGILAFARIDGCWDKENGLSGDLADGLKIGRDVAERLDFLLEICASACREMRRTVFGEGGQVAVTDNKEVYP